MDLFGKDEIEKTSIEVRKAAEQLQATLVEVRQTIQVVHSILGKFDKALDMILKQ